MRFYIAYWRIFSSNAFRGAKIATFVIYVWLILIAVLGALVLRFWCAHVLSRAYHYKLILVLPTLAQAPRGHRPSGGGWVRQDEGYADRS